MAPVNVRMTLNALNKTRLLYIGALQGISHEQAQQFTDGPDGWNILTIMCHLKDYQKIYLERLDMILGSDNPIFRSYDRFDLIEANNYAGQNIQTVLAEYSQTRDAFLAVLGEVGDEQWSRTGKFADDSELPALGVLMMLLAHDNDHLEQVTRVLREAGR